MDTIRLDALVPSGEIHPAALNQPKWARPRASHDFPAAIRAYVWDRTDGLCYYCGARINPFRDFTIDHVQAVALGGDNSLGNLVPACRPCNAAKGIRDAHEFLVEGRQQSDARNLATLHASAPNLADLVDEGRITASEAMAAFRQRKANEQARDAQSYQHRALWDPDDYALNAAELVTQRDTLHWEASALADECEERFGRAPTVPPIGGVSVAAD